MELTLEGVTSMEAGGNVTLELPAYMHSLIEHDFQLARQAPDKLERILAAGLHVPTGNMVFVTGAGDIRELDLTGALQEFSIVIRVAVNPRDFTPIDFGRSIKVDFKEDDVVKPIELEAEWCIQQSQLMIALAPALAGKSAVRITYLDDEVDTTTTTPTDS